MKITITCIFTLLLSACSGSTDVETMCYKLKDDYKELQKQLPLQSDLATSLVGIEAFYLASKNECYSTSTLNINVDSFIGSVAQNDPAIDKKKLKLFLQSEEGKTKLKGIIRSKFNKKSETNEFPTQIKGFTFKEIYSFTGAPIKKFTLVHRF
jgi:hypothetical protein